MAKKKCVVCETTIGTFTPGIAVTDGIICPTCLKNAGICTLPNAKSLNTSTAKELVNKRISLVRSFSPTKTIDCYMSVDENNKLFKTAADVFEYSNLLSFELLENGETVVKGGLGSAVVGGMIFGGVGAIVGSITGKKLKDVCISMKIRLTLKNAHTDTAYIGFIADKTKTNGVIYKDAQAKAQACISALQIITDINQSEQANISGVQTVSSADEIMKFKQLLGLV